MRELKVYVEINGQMQFVGTIYGYTYEDACFKYDTEYLHNFEAAPISISLPLQDEAFSAADTTNFFEGLLPEGFSRRAVADWIKVDEKDYLTILAVLGKECLGAIKVVEGDSSEDAGYELLSDARVKELAAEGATKSTQILMETHLSLTGATGKVGLYYDAMEDKWYLPKGDAPSTHIVKQSHVRLKQIVLNEQLCILTAKNLGIEVPHSFIVDMNSNDDELLYATERYDRIFSSNRMIDGKPCPSRLHQEDFAQALGISAKDKYENEQLMYMQKMFKLVRNHSSKPIEDQQALLRMIVFNYLIGNTDCHVKNFSLLYSSDLKSKRLAPAYDLVATRVYKTTSDMSFYIGGELDIERITRESFSLAADEIGMTTRVVLNIFDDVADRLESAMDQAANELANQGFESAVFLKKEILKTRESSGIR